jgi:BirA family biotin operon repressor/biotin-[acetyl-CoA-carboxylase] ligase
MRPIGHTILRLEETPSTNTLVLETEEYLADHGLVVLARHQTAGRGRMGRHWASVPGAQLQFSVVVHPAVRAEEVPLLALVSGLAVAQALEGLLGLSPRLKWPNDVLLDGRKVCGILLEAKPAPGTGQPPRLVIGIGLNCQGRAEDYPPDLRERVTTLAEVYGAPVDNEEVLQAVLERLNALYDRLVAGERPALLAEWRRCAALAGRRVRVQTPQGLREGHARDITGEGYLLVELEGGTRHVQVSGEVAWLD